MSDAESILAAARVREDERARGYVPPDYRAANARFRVQKSRLTRAVNSGEPERVVLACRDVVREWSEPPFNGAWPDDWSRWQRALDDALGWRSSVELGDLR